MNFNRNKFHFRKIENLHIVLWICKDTGWMMGWKLYGAIMVVPTITVAIFLCYITRKHLHRLIPNLAVLCWISANSMWMLDEFFILHIIPVAFIFFIKGMVLMAYFYFYLRPKVV